MASLPGAGIREQTIIEVGQRIGLMAPIENQFLIASI